MEQTDRSSGEHRARAAEASRRCARGTSAWSPWLTLPGAKPMVRRVRQSVLAHHDTAHTRGGHRRSTRREARHWKSRLAGDWRLRERMHHCLCRDRLPSARSSRERAPPRAAGAGGRAEAGRAVISVHLRTGYSDLAPAIKTHDFSRHRPCPNRELLELMNTCGGGLTASATTTTGSSSASSPSHTA